MGTARYFTSVFLLVFCGACARNAACMGSGPQGLDEILHQAQEEFNIPALGVIVLNGSGVVAQETIGVRDIDSGDPATAEDYFCLGSNTKAVTAFVAGKLVQDGRIDWDTRFFDLFPELSAASRIEYQSITLRDLLSHRARIPPFPTGKEIEAVPVPDGDITAKRIRFSEYVLQQPPHGISPESLFQGYSYSNAGYVLAAAMLERAGGASWEELVHRILVEDLGLSIHVGFPVDLGPGQPRGYLPGAYVGKGRDTLFLYDTEYRVKNGDVLNPSGHLSMPMVDYAKLIRLHLLGLEGVDNYLPAGMYRFMHFGTANYAMGWENGKRNGMEVSSHDGSTGNFFCHVRIVREKDLAIVVFANSGILSALNPLEYFFGGMKLEGYLDRIQALFGG